MAHHPRRWLFIFLCAAIVIVIVVRPSRTIVVTTGSATTKSTGSSNNTGASNNSNTGGNPITNITNTTQPEAQNSSASASYPTPPSFTTASYNAKLLQIANLPTPPATARATSSIALADARLAQLWPAQAAYPDAGALLPFDRIVAYYGNLYSPAMGVLGQYPSPEMLQMLTDTAAQWQAADPSTKVIPALDYIVVAAQGSPGADGDYRLRMPASQVDEIIQMANQINGIVFLDVQVGDSNVETEVPLLAQYLKLPQVELALDPEFDMHNGAKPGTVIGSMDATDINFAANFLANIVKENNLPPKILVVHRFTQPMVTNTADITPLPQVQIVMDMDGFGAPSEKLKTYQDFIQSEPVQFTGFKLFYKNDTAAGHLMTPSEVLRLTPEPSYIQYQ